MCSLVQVYPELCTRRLMVSEWLDGKKLSDCPQDEIKRLTPYAQEAFLCQLLQAGFLHSDPHAGEPTSLVYDFTSISSQYSLQFPFPLFPIVA
jgi:hypothetical protein